MRKRALLLASMVAACASPEASRARGGGPGADSGNRDSLLELHDGTQPYHQTPCVTLPEPCDGPLPVFSAPGQTG